MITVEIIADSVNPMGSRLTTAIWRYPRFIHSEIMTHRALSKNSASSRAIPVERMISDIEREAAMPVFWGKNQKGMQAAEELNDSERAECQSIWNWAKYDSIKHVKTLTSLGLHKQLANRLLEPWAHMTTLVSGTEWANFFALRVHKDAQPEFQELAYKMLKAYLNNTPKQLQEGEWHIPFSDRYCDGLSPGDVLQACVGRCARVSYNNQDGVPDLKADVALHDRLISQHPGHWTPAEHIAQARDDNDFNWEENSQYKSSNFRGWIQYRKMFNSENVEHLDLHEHLRKYEYEVYGIKPE